MNLPEAQTPPLCLLCLKKADLRLSHVLPAFIVQEMKRRSGSGFFRGSPNPNLRSQDYLKARMLCGSCEQLIGAHETNFARGFFRPFLENPEGQHAYGPWMAAFAASVVWRVVEYVALVDPLDYFSEPMRRKLEEARAKWRGYLLGTAENVGEFELHLLRLEAPRVLTPEIAKVAAPSLSRYLATALDLDVVTNDRGSFSFAKMGRFAVVGGIVLRSDDWRGTRLRMRRGEMFPRVQTIPKSVGLWLYGRSWKHWEVFEKLSGRQEEVIDAAKFKDPERVVESDAFRAMENDVRLFGPRAFSDYGKR